MRHHPGGRAAVVGLGARWILGLDLMQNDLRMDRLKLLVGLIATLCVSRARAGDPGSLCEAVRGSKDIFEIEMTVRDPVPEGYLRRHRTPEQRQFGATVKTARIVRVLKGSRFRVGEAYAAFKPLSVSPESEWRRFFTVQTVRGLVGLKALDGWIADGGDGAVGACNVNSCASYRALSNAIERCMRP